MKETGKSAYESAYNDYNKQMGGKTYEDLIHRRNRYDQHGHHQAPCKSGP